MRKMRMNVLNDKTFKQGCEEYLKDCETRNLRQGTVKHYTDVAKQLYKYIDADTPISDLTLETFNTFIIQLRRNEAINDMSLYTCKCFKT